MSDPAPGFIASIRFALHRLGVESPSDQEIENHIGPPLEDTLGALLGDDRKESLPEAGRLYRENYSSSGIYECAIYEGIAEALEEICSSAVRIFLATSKPEQFAKKILSHLGLSHYFNGVYGSQFDGGHSDKRDLLRFLSVE